MKRVAIIAILGALALAGCGTTGHAYSAQAKSACTKLAVDAGDWGAGTTTDYAVARTLGEDLLPLNQHSALGGSDLASVTRLVNDDADWLESGVQPTNMTQDAQTVGSVCQRVLSR